MATHLVSASVVLLAPIIFRMQVMAKAPSTP
uniref:Uncharacterized protein n=1 Tax=Globisporangium ultimum (strain ATCC 200006 / CBS 805.95 / DAOM BR144) TaxID=431595 RepID=K3XCP6_GLOUD